MLYPAKYTIDKNCIIVHGTDAHKVVRVVEGSEFLAAAIELPHPEKLNIKEIEMSGKQISDHLNYPDFYVCDFLVKGYVTGLTDSYLDIRCGIIPVFEAVEVYPLMSIPVFLGTEAVLFDAFPYGLCIGIIIFGWPIAFLIWIYKKMSVTQNRL